MAATKQFSNKPIGEWELSDWIAAGKEYGWVVLKYSWVMVLLAVVLGKVLRDRKLDSPVIYTANYSFTINREATQKQQNIASLFGSAGVNEENVNFKRLQELVLTRKVLARVLFDSIELRHEKPKVSDLLINHYLNIFRYRDQTPEQAKGNYYFKTDSIEPFNRKANGLIRYVHNQIIRKHLTLEPSPAGLMHIKVTSISEDFSYELAHSLYRSLSDYYSEEAARQKQRFYEMAQKRAAELQGKLSDAERRYITYVNTNGAEASGRNNTLIKTQYLSTELKKATQSYFGAVSNAEAAKVAYEEQVQTPSISEVDPPLYPLPAQVPNPLLHMIAGAILGMGLGFFLIVGVKFVLDMRRKKRLTALEPDNTANTVSDD